VKFHRVTNGFMAQSGDPTGVKATTNVMVETQRNSQSEEIHVLTILILSFMHFTFTVKLIL